MKYKDISFDYWQRIVPPNFGTAFSTTPPIQCIDGPFIAYGWAGIGTISNSSTCTPVGTIMACRIDLKDYPNVLNTNYWHLYSVGTLQIVEVSEVNNKGLIPEHHSGTIPLVFQNSPQVVKNLISDAIDNAVKIKIDQNHLQSQ